MRALLALLPVAALLSAPLLTPACVIPSISSTDDAGSTSATATGDASAPATVQGASCTPVSSSISLCEYISVCPSLVLNAQVFPQCGFRIHGTAIDPECLCLGHYLCPIGVNPTSCTQAASEASGDTTYDSVCEQAVLGSCTDLTASSGSSSGSSSGGSSNACQTCIQNCDNVPACIDACTC